MHFAFWSIFALLEIHIIYLIDYNIMTWHDFQETKPVLDCEQEAEIETEVATVEEEEGEGRTLVHEEEEERISAKDNM